MQMLSEMKIRNAVILGHGILAIVLGAVLFFLRTIMEGLLLEALAVVAAIMLAAAALLLAGLVDWFAAAAEGIKHVHRVAFYFYMIGGTILVVAGVFFGYYPRATLQLLVIIALIQALVSGLSALIFAIKAEHHRFERRALYFIGTLSILFSGAMAGLVKDLTHQEATTILAAYLCFLGVKMLFFGWRLYRKTILIKNIVNEASTQLTR